MVESASIVIGPSPGPAPAAHARPRTCPVSRSSWRVWPKVNARRNVPTVDGASTRWPSTVAVDPQRSTSTSSMQSPPARIPWTRVSSLAPGWAAPGRCPRSMSWSAACSIPSRSVRVAGSSRPALAMAWVSSKAMSSWSRVWEDRSAPFHYYNGAPRLRGTGLPCRSTRPGGSQRAPAPGPRRTRPAERTSQAVQDDSRDRRMRRCAAREGRRHSPAPTCSWSQGR